MFWPNRHTPPSPSRRRAASHSGSVVPTNPGSSVAAMLRRRSGSVSAVSATDAPAHPLTAPLTSPLVIRPCTIRKKMMTGTATRVDAAMTWPQSVAREADC